MNTKIGKVLVVDDDKDVLLAARLLLKKHAELVHTETNPEVIPSLLKNENYDIILLDMNFTADASSGQEGFFWLSKIFEIDSSAVVVVITAYGDVEMAVRAIKEGATDFVLKPWQNEKLLATLSAVMKLRTSRTEVNSLRLRQKQLSADLDQQFGNFIGVSSPMQKVFTTIQKVSQTDANVLILGENGTGKELVARELHRQSLRTNEVFISVDMGAISETLFESELFGHVKGAFTDAREDRAGRFEVASGGTLFLDEICNLPLPLQAKILTAIENHEVTRVGSNKPCKVNVRLICATNLNIHAMVEEQKFRQDLLYRINTVEIHLPPLRERDNDIPLLIDHFLSIYSKKYNKPHKRVSSASMEKLKKYQWPGNVRELQHAIERAIIMSDSKVLQPSDFLFPGKESKENGLVVDDYNIEGTEKILIRKALMKHSGNVSKAAHELGISRASLYRRLEKYGL
ncbi:MAG: sigma-54-dependent Fis family transcriptional regulator [Candidatus Latescibacteria bacterium]|nr:sigma-54-dependent Fis family transcriptional regulator [Candidatus Latescibacterota bacterium]